jgi:hypothetical protein
MVLPFLFGNPSDGSYFGKESFADYCAYAGFGVLVLAGLGIWDWVVKFLTRRYTPTRLRAHMPAPLHAYTLARPARLHALFAGRIARIRFNLQLAALLLVARLLSTWDALQGLCSCANWR